MHVQVPGLLTTVQDLGREGYGPLGVSPSGAADAIALALANRLAGNPDNTAALEMTLVGGTFLFPDGAVAALAGSDFGAHLNGVPVRPWSSFRIEPGQALQLGATSSGARCYLAVHGGFAVDAVLGSASTHLLSGVGGFHGRALRKSDTLPIGSSAPVYRKRTADPDILGQLAPRKHLRITPGPQRHWFTEASERAFLQGAYRVTEESNRMGLRLEGPALETVSTAQLISEGVPLGAIQVPAGGQPIILFVEQQTAGGYPKVANIIACDLPSVGQLRPRDEIQFEPVSFEVARSLLLRRAHLLNREDLIQP